MSRTSKTISGLRLTDSGTTPSVSGGQHPRNAASESEKSSQSEAFEQENIDAEEQEYEVSDLGSKAPVEGTDSVSQADEEVVDDKEAETDEDEPEAEKDDSEDDGLADEEGGDLELGDEDESELGPVNHHEIWDELVNLADPVGYVHGAAHGADMMDVTALVPRQAGWGADRPHRPTILSLWGRPVPWNNPTYDAGVLKYNGRTVLDWEGKPINAFRNLPLTISSNVEGMRVEVWQRQDKRITQRDIIARLRTELKYVVVDEKQEEGKGAGAGGALGREKTKGKKQEGAVEELVRMPVFDMTYVRKRAHVFRQEAGCPSWTLRKDQEKARAWLSNLRTQAQRDNNFTMDRDLTIQELAKFRSFNMEQNPNRGGDRDAKNHRAYVGRAKKLVGEDNLDEESSSEAAETAAEERTQYNRIDGDDEISASDDSLTNEPEDPTDSRNDIPYTVQEIATLKDALKGTRAHFRALLGQKPATRKPDLSDQSYLTQLGALQMEFNSIWKANGNKEAAPLLCSQDRWTGGILNWKSAETIAAEEFLRQHVDRFDATHDGRNADGTWKVIAEED